MRIVTIFILAIFLLSHSSCNRSVELPPAIPYYGEWTRIYKEGDEFTVPDRQSKVYMRMNKGRITIIHSGGQEEYEISRVEVKTNSVYSYLAEGYKIFLKGNENNYFDVDIIDDVYEAYKWTWVEDGVRMEEDPNMSFYIIDSESANMLPCSMFEIPSELKGKKFYTLVELRTGRYALDSNYKEQYLDFYGGVLEYQEESGLTTKWYIENVVEQKDRTWRLWLSSYSEKIIYELKEIDSVRHIYYCSIPRTDNDDQGDTTEASEERVYDLLSQSYIVLADKIDTYRRINNSAEDRLQPDNFSGVVAVDILSPIYKTTMDELRPLPDIDNDLLRISNIDDFLTCRISSARSHMIKYDVLDTDYNGDGRIDKLLVTREDYYYGDSVYRYSYPIQILEKQSDGSYIVTVDVMFDVLYNGGTLQKTVFEGNKLELTFEAHGITYYHTYLYDKVTKHWLREDVRRTGVGGNALESINMDAIQSHILKSDRDLIAMPATQ